MEQYTETAGTAPDADNVNTETPAPEIVLEQEQCEPIIITEPNVTTSTQAKRAPKEVPLPTRFFKRIANRALQIVQRESC